MLTKGAQTGARCSGSCCGGRRAEGGLQEESPVTGPSPPRPALPGRSTPITPTIKNPEHPFTLTGQQECQRRVEEEGLSSSPAAGAPSQGTGEAGAWGWVIKQLPGRERDGRGSWGSGSCPWSCPTPGILPSPLPITPRYPSQAWAGAPCSPAGLCRQPGRTRQRRAERWRSLGEPGAGCPRGG